MSAQQFIKVLEELSERATPGPWRKSKGNIGNGIEGPSGKKSDFYLGDDGYRMLATYQQCESTGKWKEEEENQAANGDLIVFLANNRQQIIDLVKAAEEISCECNERGYRLCCNAHIEGPHHQKCEINNALAALKDKP